MQAASPRGITCRTLDCPGAFEYLESPAPLSGEAELAPGDPRLHGTPPMPIPPVAR